MSRTAARLTFRRGRAADLRATVAVARRAVRDTAGGPALESHGESDEVAVERQWREQRPLVEFLTAQEGSEFWVCEGDGEIVGYARMLRFGAMEELSAIMVDPRYQRRGIARGLLERCWPEAPTPDLARLVAAAGSVPDLTLYTQFGVMPVTGHWRMVLRTADYTERRSLEVDSAEPAVHLLDGDRALEEWARLEPPAIEHERPLLHEFFGRERTCLAHLDPSSGAALGLCWVSGQGQIGPAVGAGPEDLVPVVLAALDRVAKTYEPEHLALHCTTDSWWLLDRLRRLGFRVSWPGWVLCSHPLPGLDRYLPTRPAVLL